MSGTVAILSTGEMGHAIGRVLRHHGCRVITSLAGRSARTAELAGSAGVEDVGSLDEVVRQAEIVLSVMPSAAAPGIADEIARRAPRLLFVECNALAPEQSRAICARVAAAGARVADVGIVGAPPTVGKSPRFYASGPGAQELAGLGERGLDVRVIGSEIGQASGMKMVYAALTKGLSALGTELLLAAERMELLDPLLDELTASQPAQLKWLESSVPGMPPKARRWVSEMEEISATFAALGLSPKYHQAAAELYRWVGASELGQERPESRDQSRTLRQVVETLAEARRSPV
jgi:3-hydroxyisobutyrate dehydrogenase-like beta-hydroxyacid dehydrogenase